MTAADFLRTEFLILRELDGLSEFRTTRRGERGGYGSCLSRIEGVRSAPGRGSVWDTRPMSGSS